MENSFEVPLLAGARLSHHFCLLVQVGLGRHLDWLADGNYSLPLIFLALSISSRLGQEV